MLVNGQYKPGDIVLLNWTLKRLIGEGSFGRVFEAERWDFGTAYKSAIKIITIPQNQSEIVSARSEGMDYQSVAVYFGSLVEEIVREFKLMSELKGTSNIVSYEDHAVIKHSTGIGWDILIRMELLMPLLDYTVQQSLTRHDVIKLGMDICRALEVCQRFNVVHRDIKPENIFISKLGDYKLGDFGIARTVEKTTSGLSTKGTYTYMAPEIYRGEAYGSSVDIYSLGLVLFRLLNDNRAPFLPNAPAPITHSDREASLIRRISGERLPHPRNADDRLAEIVIKACSYDPKDRYSNPMFMRQELETILSGRDELPVVYPKGDAAPFEPSAYAQTSHKSHTSPSQGQGRPPTAKNNTVSLFQAATFTGDKTKGLPLEPSRTATTDNSSGGRRTYTPPMPTHTEKKGLSALAAILMTVAVLVVITLTIIIASFGGNRDDSQVNAGNGAGNENPQSEPPTPQPPPPPPSTSDEPRFEQYDTEDGYRIEVYYDANGNTISEKSFSPEGLLLYWSEYEYDDFDRCVISTMYNVDGSYRVEEFDSSGNTVAYTQHNTFGFITNRHEFFFDINGLTVMRRDYWYGVEYDVEEGELAYYTENELNESGGLIVAYFYYPDGTLFETIWE